MGRKILLITTDQMRYDALGCNGGKYARTANLDALSADGISYRRAHANNVLCMPARASIISGQYVRTHGVWSNGVPQAPDQPNVARHLHDNGYRTALVGKAHFEPFIDAEKRFYENLMAGRGETGPYRGFEHVELANHSGRGLVHYSTWLRQAHPEAVDGFYRILRRDLEQSSAGGGETGAVQVAHNPIARAFYHTDWTADRAIAWLDTLDTDCDWFLWLSFPDPHHPWDPPQSELHRHNWRDIDLPAAYEPDDARREAILAAKPRHWLDWYRGERTTCMEAPPDFVPADMTADQIREINAVTHVENELIDEATGRVLDRIAARGWSNDTDVIFTTDHGELQGDFGLLFKGPYHVDALMRLPMIWRPAPAAGIAPAEITAPVEQVDLAPTICTIAGLKVPDWMQGTPLPTDPSDAEAQRRQRTLTEWDNEYRGDTVHMRTIYRDGWICTVCEAGTIHTGDEGELYDLDNDPRQFENLWDDPARQSLKKDLIADLYDNLPSARSPRLEKVAPA